jgi:hypothetical protein
MRYAWPANRRIWYPRHVDHQFVGACAEAPILSRIHGPTVPTHSKAGFTHWLADNYVLKLCIAAYIRASDAKLLRA